MRRYILGILILLSFTTITRVSAFSPKFYDVISIQFFEGNEPIANGYQVDVLLPRDELDPVWLEGDVNLAYKQVFPDYSTFTFMSDTAEYVSYRAYSPYIYYEPFWDDDGYIIMDEHIYDFSSFQIVIFDKNDTIIYTSEVMEVYETFGTSILQAEGNHYFHYHVDTNELDMIPYEDTSSAPEDMVFLIAILAVFAILAAMAPVIMIWLGVATVLFIIMIVWIKSGQRKYPKQ